MKMATHKITNRNRNPVQSNNQPIESRSCLGVWRDIVLTALTGRKGAANLSPGQCRAMRCHENYQKLRIETFVSYIIYIFLHMYMYIFLFNVCHSKNSPKHNMSKCKICPNLDPVTASHPLSSHCESVQIVNRPGCRFQHGCWKPDFAHVGLCAQMGPAWTP